MTKAIFTSKIEPSYDDLPEQRYHFPRTYLRQVEAAVGDWIVYYEPRRASSDLSSRGGRQAYFATAKVQRIVPDPTIDGHFYAYVSDYLEFDRSVRFKDGDHFYEASLRRDDGGTSKGAFGRAVRNIPDVEYDLILKAGFAQAIVESNPRLSEVPTSAETLDEEAREFERPIVEMVVARPFRDAAFAAAVKSAYRNTCAMTGLQIINGGGHADRSSAHSRLRNRQRAALRLGLVGQARDRAMQPVLIGRQRSKLAERFVLGLRDQRHNRRLAFAVRRLAAELEPDVVRIHHID